MFLRSLVTGAVTAVTLTSAAAHAQVQRTYVASFGSDVNVATNCTLATPCRSFAAAQTATQSGGEIIALDAAGYGAVAITKSLSIIANPGAYAGISASTGNAVTIEAAGVNVRLRGLKINGVGGTSGILMTNGASLTVVDCSVTGFTWSGIDVKTAAQVRIMDSVVENNGFAGVWIEGGATADLVGVRSIGQGYGVAAQAIVGVTSVAVTNSVSSQNEYGFFAMAGVNGTVRMSVSASTADHNFTGFQAGASSVLSLASSKSTANVYGLHVLEGGVLNSAGNNLVTGNTFNTQGTITTVGTM